MQKHKTNCQHCGQEFESNRSDAKYCSKSCKSRASQLRLNKNPVINITYDEDELEQLSEIAEIFDLSIEELVKHKSLLTEANIHQSNDLLNALELEIKQLKAELSIYTKTPGEGIFLNYDKTEQSTFFESMKQCKILEKYDSDIKNNIQLVICYCIALEEANKKLITVINKNGLGNQVKL